MDISKIKDTLKRATDFGTFSARKSFQSFFIKMIIYFIIAITTSHILDELMGKLYNKYNKQSIINGLLIVHTLLIIAIIYLFTKYFIDFTKEFQLTAAGGIFIAFFYGFQHYYMDRLKSTIRLYDFIN